MATIDIIILIIIGAGAIVGFMKGFIRQLASILGLIVGLLALLFLYITYHLDSRSTDILIGGFVADKGNESGFAGLVEPLARLCAGST